MSPWLGELSVAGCPSHVWKASGTLTASPLTVSRGARVLLGCLCELKPRARLEGTGHSTLSWHVWTCMQRPH